MNISVVSSCVAAALNVVGFIVYVRHLLQGKSKPSIVSWLILSLACVLITGTYKDVSHDIVKTFTLIAATVCTCGFFLYLAYNKSRWSFKWVDIASFFLAIAAAIIWLKYRQTEIAHIWLLQPILILGFIPSYRNVLQNPENECRWAWMFWTISHVFNLLTVWLRWRDQPIDLVNPVVQETMNLGMMLLSNRFFLKSKPTKATQ